MQYHACRVVIYMENINKTLILEHSPLRQSLKDGLPKVTSYSSIIHRWIALLWVNRLIL